MDFFHPAVVDSDIAGAVETADFGAPDGLWSSVQMRSAPDLLLLSTFFFFFFFGDTAEPDRVVVLVIP